MTKFRCIRSGNLVSFSNEDDIKHMRAHEGYEEVKNEDAKEAKQEVPVQIPNAEKVLKKRGRQQKEAVTEI